MSQTFLQLQPIQLSGSGITATATSIGVQSFQDVNGNDIVTADLGDKCYATLEPNTTREEIISFTGVTHSSTDLTATLTGVTRNLDYTTPYTQISATGFAHSGGTSLVVSNNPQVYDDMTSNANAETITGLWTFSNAAIPRLDTYVAPTDNAELASKQYVDDTSAGVPVSQNRIVVAATAGETVSAGQSVYYDSGDTEWKLTDANTTSTVDNVLLGIAQGAGTDGVGITGGVLVWGLDSNQSGLTAGNYLYASDTAGAIANSAGTTEVTLGIAKSATEMYFFPRFDQQITETYQDALAGTSGTPAAGNLYVTELGLQRSIECYAADAEASDTYVVTLDPVPTAYVAGMTIRVKFNTANTTAATINVNSLGAKSITKNGTTALSTGDISAAQVSTLVYDGTQFQLQGAGNVGLTDGGNADDLHVHTLRAFKTGSVAHVGSSGDQTIAHGLGKTPVFIKITAMSSGTNDIASVSVGTATSISDETVAYMGQGGTDSNNGVATGYIIQLTNGATDTSLATVQTLDATNIVLDFTDNDTDNVSILWEAYG